jgi:hypothetical protein
MRFPRVKADGQGYYHCVSRVVEGRFIFEISGHGSGEAEQFIKLMRRLEAFSGVRVLTYVLMSIRLFTAISGVASLLKQSDARRRRLLLGFRRSSLALCSADRRAL